MNLFFSGSAPKPIALVICFISVVGDVNTKICGMGNKICKDKAICKLTIIIKTNFVEFVDEF